MIHLAPMTEAEAAGTAGAVDDERGLGALRTERGNLPLDALDLKADITGLTSAITLTQHFVNVHDQPLEATYVFPLPDRAAVTGMRMTAADRVIEAKLSERGAAREAYDTAIAAGQRASIAEEERPDVFTMRVGNIVPGERVTVELRLAGPLSHEDGEATFRFPLVVAPRYIPGVPLGDEQVGAGYAPDTDAVPDASRITPPVLLPGFPNPVRLTIDVGIDPAGLPLREVRSSLHAVTEEGGRYRINPGERANRDFILRFAYGSADAQAAALTVVPDAAGDGRGEGGTYQLTVLPPTGSAPPRPRDVVLLLDRSGSMGGWKMVAARRAAARIVDTLTDADRFAVLAFDHSVEAPPSLPSGLVAGTDRHRYRAVEHLSRMDARGGTELLAPLRDGLALLTDESRDRVLVLVTDGQVGNEDQILRESAQAVQGVRVHTVGIDQAVNAGFLGRLAAAGGGRCELVESEDRLDDAMDRIHRRIGSPLVTGVSVSASSLSLVDGSRVPARLPDVFPGVPYVVTGRYKGVAEGALTVTGSTRDGRQWTVTATGERHDHPALHAIWARAHLRELEDRYVTRNEKSLSDEIVATSLGFGVLCRFTAYLAVDSRVVNEGGEQHRIVQPVESAAGWDMLGSDRAGAPMMRLASMAMPTAAPGGAFPAGMPVAAAADFAVMEAEAVPPPAQAGYAPPPPARSTGGQMLSGKRRRAPLVSRAPVNPAPARERADEATGLPDLRALAAAEARRLREAAGLAEFERRELLEDLGSRLAVLATSGPLHELAQALRPEALAGRPIDEVWAEALRLLDEYAGPSSGERKRSFWK
jgi:Ca-activated chloride channel family protein